MTLANYNAVKNDTALSPAVAVVYKNDSVSSKVYIVGKEHEKNGLAWCLDSAKGSNTNLISLQCEPDSDGSAGDFTWVNGQNTDGSGNWQKLRQELAGDDDTDPPGKYLAWEWVNSYGQTLTGDLATGWYLPSIAELFDIWKANSTDNAIENALTAVDGDSFGSNNGYWSSSQSKLNDTGALILVFGAGIWLSLGKSDTGYSVCAVRAFTY